MQHLISEKESLSISRKLKAKDNNFNQSPLTKESKELGLNCKDGISATSESLKQDSVLLVKDDQS